MKKILASLITLSAVAGFASAASAQNATSAHSGSVTAACTLTATNGTFPVTGLANSMTSAGGSFSTVCNSAASTLTLSAGAAPTLPVGSVAAEVTTSFDVVTAGSGGAYDGILPGVTTVTNLSNSYSSTPSVLNVAAKATAGSGKNLPSSASGGYVVNILATVAP
jgi:hypothetical protein